eukprot:5224470-Pleurochrysis_carterae.AAC.1
MSLGTPSTKGILAKGGGTRPITRHSLGPVDNMAIFISFRGPARRFREEKNINTRLPRFVLSKILIIIDSRALVLLPDVSGVDPVQRGH